MTQTADPSTSSASSGGSRAFFGLDSPRAVRLLGVGCLLVLMAALIGVVLSHNSSSPAGPLHHSAAARTTHHAAATTAHHNALVARYGGLPAWLPKTKTPVGRVLHASRAHPALSLQGEPISVDLDSGNVLATAAGPSVPEEGRTPVPATSPCTFIVTFAHISGAIPISATAFTFIDELGHVRHPHVTSMTGGPPPLRVLPGKTVSLTVNDILPTGDGALRWAPTGGRPIASWDFDIEID
jgi:hypothetical protein